MVLHDHSWRLINVGSTEGEAVPSQPRTGLGGLVGALTGLVQNQ